MEFDWQSGFQHIRHQSRHWRNGHSLRGKGGRLSAASYPYWGRMAIVPKSASFTCKYIKKDASGAVAWESGGNRAYTTGSGSGYSVSDTWQ
ncbi:carbohydrate-binding module family 20 domain-containing protein [Streptomyces sp. NPDC058751]|uniref:carbohydrate-binding module family 20 domain-containing protein n=1 Tax=Streptomyces sp. NPDC058751 TaxID=3346623 RepID=UPI0036C3EC2C